ncbi:hypothetical protein SAMN04489859_104032 [Paracoccus alcaliphilus]|uniref:Uncharacterized protein n=1 Tax=Paracoccus alcaliphilus TaxID=34002 RepID=A0A1H8MHU9_9RHOB|nr:hypothetical protein SAMN04489859_104032 [Paracoccus alcaliphilus]
MPGGRSLRQAINPALKVIGLTATPFRLDSGMLHEGENALFTDIAYPRTFMLFCRQVLATDFKAMHRVQLGEAPQLLEVGESGEFKRGTLGESKESYKVKIFLLVPQVKLPKRLDLARDADRVLDDVPGLIVANWVEARA